jgi:hypothetical protein
LFATELVNNGLPIHIGAKLLGHLDLHTTQGYVAVFEEGMVRHYQDFLARRRRLRPDDEYGAVTDQDWQEFEEHFDKRKVELGSCARPYGIPCLHEHACLSCPMFITTADFLPQHHEHRQQVLQIISAAEARGQQRLSEMNRQVLGNLDRIIGALEDDDSHRDQGRSDEG